MTCRHITTGFLAIALILALAAGTLRGADQPPAAGPDIKAVRGAEFPRDFTRGLTNAGDWSQLEPLFEKLAAQIKEVKTPEELRAWLLRRSELASVISEEGTRRSIAYTCHTDDPAAEKANLEYLEKINPKLKEKNDQLNRLYLACPSRGKGDPKEMEVYDHTIDNIVKLFRQENVPLQTQDDKLAQEYMKINGGITVQWQGAEKTQEQMAIYLQSNDRKVREETYRLVWSRRLKETAKINEIYDKLIKLRTEAAKNAGFKNYSEFQHMNYNRFDYTPQDCLAFDEAIAREVVPLVAKLRRERREKMGLESLRPWDVKASGSWDGQADAQGRPALHPFQTGTELEAGVAKIYATMSPELSAQFALMRQQGLLDLLNHKGKAPGAYQSDLAEVRLPFVFVNATGSDQDIYTMLHENGHAFHSLAYRQQPLVDYRSAPIEFCEVSSMAMEMFGQSQIEVFYKNPDEARRSRRDHLEEFIQFLPWMATIDAFQQWVYMNPNHTDAEREAKWLELDRKYSPEVDWSGLEAEQRQIWQRQHHLFDCPLYYVEYGIAELGALQLWVQFRDKPQETLANYRRAQALGNSRRLSELFRTAGMKFDFSPDMIRPLMKAVSEELDRLK